MCGPCLSHPPVLNQINHKHHAQGDIRRYYQNLPQGRKPFTKSPCLWKTLPHQLPYNRLVPSSKALCSLHLSACLYVVSLFLQIIIIIHVTDWRFNQPEVRNYDQPPVLPTVFWTTLMPIHWHKITAAFKSLWSGYGLSMSLCIGSLVPSVAVLRWRVVLRGGA